MRHRSPALGSRSIATASVCTAAPSTPPTAAAATSVHSSRTRVRRNGPFAYQRSKIAVAQAAAADRDGTTDDQLDRRVVPRRRAGGGERTREQWRSPRARRRQQQDDEDDARGAGHRGGEDAAGVQPPSPQLDREHHDGDRERGECGPHHPGRATAGGGVRDDVDQRVLRARVARSDATNQRCGRRSDRAARSRGVATGPAGRTGPVAIGGKAGTHPRQHQVGAATWCRTARPSRPDRHRR